ncbi:hypothetical protein HUF18_04230 [Thalassolituus sp. ST750PaO-4]|uniref:hypothetical protein n=1 Tax=Thalassolituus sp. ST750PaO-4 TaxID=2742965 RepID=UPI001CE29921|nr:hypothetical protein [Thalassolituus sp. ST750PaO-4]MCA6058972.1 hypothetical protein [Thalassolituus sp. ST750PaO-4]
MAAAKLRSGRNPDIKKPALFAQSGLLLQKTESLTLAQFCADLLAIVMHAERCVFQQT